jgi:hypothetical protein
MGISHLPVGNQSTVLGFGVIEGIELRRRGNSK